MKKLILIIILICSITHVFAYEMDYVPYRKGNMYGISNREGKLVVKAEYNFITLDAPYIFAYKDSEVTVFNHNLKIIGIYNGRASSSDKNLFLIKDMNQIETLRDSSGKIILKSNNKIRYGHREGIWIMDETVSERVINLRILNDRFKLLAISSDSDRLDHYIHLYKGKATHVSNGKLITVDTIGNRWSATIPKNAEYEIKCGFTVFYNEDGYGVYNPRCQLIVPQQKEYAIAMYGFLYAIKAPSYFNIRYRNDSLNLSGIIDTSGKLIAKPIYDKIETLFKDLYLVTEPGKAGYKNNQRILDKKGMDLFGFNLEVHFKNSERAIISTVGKDGETLYGMLNKKLQWLVPFDKYVYINGYSSGSLFLIIVAKGDCRSLKLVKDGNKECKQGLIDLQGNEKLPCIYTWIQAYGKGFFIVDLDGKKSLIDSTGKEIYPLDDYFFYGNLPLSVENYWHLNYREFSSNKKLILLDSNARNINGQLYDSVKYSRKARVSYFMRDGKSFFISPNGHEIPTGRFDEVDQSFPNITTLSIVKLKGKYGVLDESGNFLVVPFLARALLFENGIIITTNDKGKMGLISKDGKEQLPCKYQFAETYIYGPNFISDGLVHVISGEYGKYNDYVGTNGVEYFEE